MRNIDIKEYLKKFFTQKDSDNLSLNEEVLSEKARHLISELSDLCPKDFAPDKDKIWSSIQNEIKIKRKKSRKILSLSSAAITLLALSLSTVLYFYVQRNEDMYEMMASNPGIEPIKIVLDNGETIFPQAFDNDTIISVGGGNLVLNNSANLKYEKEENEVTELVYNTVIVPKGQDYYFILSDGTEVWLNSDSKLRFPVNFYGEERKVFLEGEGFFDVSVDKDKPFRVELNKGLVEVLGTSFNIHSYADREESSTTLVSGKIKFIRSSDEKEWILNPGKQLILKENEIKVEAVNTEEVIAWKEGKILFNNKSLEDIFYQVEKWFKTEAVFAENDFKLYTVTGVIKRSDSIKEMLEIFEEITPFEYKQDHNKILITKKKTQKKKK